MLESDRQMYKDRVEINVQKDFLNWGKYYHDDNLYNRAYFFLLSKCELPKNLSEKKINILSKLLRWKR